MTPLVLRTWLISYSSPETTKLILQTLLTLVSQVEGALRLLKVDDLSPLTEIATQDPLTLDIIRFSLSNASTISSEIQLVRQRTDTLISNLLLVFKGTDAVTFLDFLAKTLPQQASEVGLALGLIYPLLRKVQTLSHEPQWLNSIINILRALVLKRPTSVSRTVYTSLAATLLQTYPNSAPTLLFAPNTRPSDSERTFSELFVTLLLIDIQASIPTLLSKLNDPSYPAISLRLASAFDILSSFIGFLIRSLDDETATTFSIPPDVILKLRKEIAQTMSLTIEYLRDRWGASIAGTAGLDPSVRAGTAATSAGTHLTLTWESMKDDVHADHLMLAALRALAIWIRENDNENLRNEAAGLMDLFVELYKSNSAEGLDFRYPILMALEGIMSTEYGVSLFLKNEGWQALASDLTAIINTPPPATMASDIARGMQIIRVLLAIIDHLPSSSTEESWLALATTTASLTPLPVSSPPTLLELHIAMLQLSSALLQKANSGMQKRHLPDYEAIMGVVVTQTSDVMQKMEDRDEAKVFGELLDDVVWSLMFEEGWYSEMSEEDRANNYNSWGPGSREASPT